MMCGGPRNAGAAAATGSWRGLGQSLLSFRSQLCPAPSASDFYPRVTRQSQLGLLEASGPDETSQRWEMRRDRKLETDGAVRVEVRSPGSPPPPPPFPPVP